jgi:hypothetical protein
LKGRNFEAGHTTAPDHMPDRAKKGLAFMGASKHVRQLRFRTIIPRHQFV